MEIEQAHRLYQEFQKTNEGARRKQGLGFGSSAVTSPPRRQVAPQPVAELLTAAPAIAASHRRGRQHDDAQIFEWSLDSGQQAIAGHGDAPAALPSQSPDAERKPEGAAAQEAAAKGGPEPDGRLRTAAAREDDRRRTPEDNRPSKRRQDAGPSDQRSHARDKTRSRERSSDTRRWRRTAGSPARRDDEHRRRRSPSDEPRRPHGDDARNGKWQLEDSRRGESDRRHEERRPAGRDRDERRDGDQRERRRRRSSSRCSSPRRHSRSPRRRSRSPRRRGRSPQRRGYSPRRRSPSPRRRGPSSRQHSRSPQRRGRSREYSPDTRRRRTPADRSDRQPHRAPGHRCGGSRSPDGSRDRWRANGAGVDDGRHRPREDAVRDSDRDRRSNGGFHSASDSRPVQRVDFASVIEGYVLPIMKSSTAARPLCVANTADTAGMLTCKHLPVFQVRSDDAGAAAQGTDQVHAGAANGQGAGSSLLPRDAVDCCCTSECTAKVLDL